MNSRDRLLMSIYHEEPDRVPITPRIGARFVPWLYPDHKEPYWKIAYYTYRRFKFDIYIDGLSPPGLVRIPILLDFRPSSKVPFGYEGISIEISTHDLNEDYKIVTRIIKTPKGLLRDRIKVPKPVKLKELKQSWRFMCSPSWVPCPYPFIIEHLVKTLDDVEKVEYILPDPGKVSEREIKKINDFIGNDGLISFTAGNTIDYAIYALGLKNSLLAYFRNRELLASLLKVFHEHTLAVTEALLERGAEIIFHSNFMGGVSAGWSPRIWNHLFKPLIKEHALLVKKMGGLFHYYDDGKIMDILDYIRELNIDIITIAPERYGNDLKLVKLKLGNRMCLKGGIDPDIIRFGSMDEVICNVRSAIGAMANGGGLILSSSDSLHAYTPFENIRVLINEVKKYGTYPLKQ